jgi:hypothetical protein
MSCERYAEAIVDHACGADIDAAAAAHLRSCDACAALFDRQQRLLHAMDRDLQRALEIEPSPGFAPAVRARVEQSAAGRSTLWWGALAAAAVLLIVVAIASRQSPDAPIVSRVEPPASPTAPDPPPLRDTSAGPEQPPATGDVRQPLRFQQRRASRTRTPEPPVVPVEVLVPPDRSQALDRYLALVRRGAFDATNLEPRVGIAAAGDLTVTPLSVQELSVPDVETGIGPDVVRRGPE